MAIYKIPVVWNMWGIMEIEAETLREAELKAMRDAPLPYGDKASYIDESIVIDKEAACYGEFTRG